MVSAPPESLERFVKETGPRLKQALIASFGGELGREATAEALSYAWAQWDRIEAMENPAGYVYSVGRNWARKAKRRETKRAVLEATAVVTAAHAEALPSFEPGLVPALEGLSEKQRIAAVLVHGFEWSVTEVGRMLGISAGAAHKHAERGLAKLRSSLGVEPDVFG